MPQNNKAKTISKRVIKKSLVLTKKALSKSKKAKRAGYLVRNVLFSGDPTPNVYHIARYAPTIPEYLKQLKESESLTLKPLISIVMPTYNTPIPYLKECIESVLIQSYSNWELCIADDASSSKEVVKTIKDYMTSDKRIKLVERKDNGHISAATNSAINIAGGEFIALLDHDDVLWPNALYEVVSVINRQPEVDLIYTDEDKIDSEGKTHSYPFFKPDWSPEFLESCNYITHFSTMRKSLIAEIGGLRVGYEGAQDWDLLLRLTEKTSNIVHVSKVLYSWRIHEDSTAMDTDAKPYVYEAQNKLLKDHIERLGEKALVKQGVIKQHSSVEYAVNGNPHITIIIVSTNRGTFRKCVTTIMKHLSYSNVEVILVPNSKKEHDFSEHVTRAKSNFSLIRTKDKLQPSRYNAAVEQAKGEYLLFVEDSLLVSTPNWVNLLLGDAQRSGVGVVGGKVLNRTKQHFLRAGDATGIYGLYAPLLEGMPVEDVHYMRGLYGQSRRNVSVLDGCFMLTKQVFMEVGGFDTHIDDMFVADLCLKILEKGLRNIYNPFVCSYDLTNKTAGDADMRRDKDAIKLFQKRWREYIEYDPYLNQNFTRTNAQLEVK